MTNPDGYIEIEELTLGCDSQETHEALDDYAETHKSLGDYQLMEPELRERFQEVRESIFGYEVGDDVPQEQEVHMKSEVLNAFRNKYGDLHEGGELFVREGAIDLEYMPERAQAKLEINLNGVDPINVYCGENDASVGRVTGIRGEAPPEGNNGIR